MTSLDMLPSTRQLPDQARVGVPSADFPIRAASRGLLPITILQVEATPSAIWISGVFPILSKFLSSFSEGAALPADAGPLSRIIPFAYRL